MKTPDKIYVFQHGINAFDPLWHFTESKEKYTDSHEYIRKDIVFDLLKGFDNPVTKLAYREIIEKLESL